MMKSLLKKIGFSPQENTAGVFQKKYAIGCTVTVDFENGQINYGSIQAEAKTTQNFSQAENWVVLECVDRLLEKGYKPEDIILEKTWKLGHQEKGRLDIFVKKKNKAFLMIECKTWGKEYEKELKNIYKDGGQLFSYFQQDTGADFLMLYTSHFVDGQISYINQIVKIEDHYRGAGSAADLFDRWNKVPNDNGIFEEWVQPYDFENKALTLRDLKPLTEEDSKFIYYGFLSILRKHAISDKPNAFNKIFNLFMCKIFDEKKRQTDELDFQWKEKTDNHIDFQIRLINLHKKAMLEFLKKEVEGIEDSDFKGKTGDDLVRQKKKWLKFNNVLAIKEVVDDESFEDNARVIKELVELLQKYQVRYPRKQQHLSDFFELLLTTGLKQEAGQFFTPPPITRFVVRSVPLRQKTKEILKNNETPRLPAIIDYAAGSGHFLTETMEELQTIIDNLEIKGLYPDVIDQIDVWQRKKFDWAAKYIYGIEKDYRLVKVAKVGCYFYGDGLAQVVHGDGLDSFAESKSYRGLLKDNAEKPQFDFVLSNPPYSVATFKGDMKTGKDPEKDFELYSGLTDRSSEIEALFVERTKQLLKEDGIAAIILPSSILNNTGLYTRAREILLKYFEFVAIAKFGSGTFMATGTNTVVLFLRRRSNELWQKVDESVKNFFTNNKDVTVKGVEKVFSKYVTHTWESISFTDYQTLLKKSPNEVIQKHEIFVEAKKKSRAKDEMVFLDELLRKEQEKILYFILVYGQKIVIVDSGSKKEEKKFLGYEFSNRKGSEGMHPIKRGASVDDCTKLYDPQTLENPDKASTYIMQAFAGDFSSNIPDDLRKHVCCIDLVDMLTFDRFEFEKTISTSAKKKIKMESKWEFDRLGNICDVVKGVTYSKENQSQEETAKIILTADNIALDGSFEIKKQIYLDDSFEIAEEKKLKKNDIFICFSSGSKEHLGKVAFMNDDTKYYAGGFMGIVRVQRNKKDLIESKYVYTLLNTIFRQVVRDIGSGSNINNLSAILNELKIPLPPKDVQQKIVNEIEVLEKGEEKMEREIEKKEKRIKDLFQSAFSKATTTYRLSDGDIFDMSIGKRVLNSELIQRGGIPVYSANIFEPFGRTDKELLEDFDCASVLWGIDGDWMVNHMPPNQPFYPTDHCGVLRIKDGKLSAKYVAFVLQKEGGALEFSRSKRASIERVQGIKIKAPSLAEQEKIIAQVEKIEKEIEALKKKLIEMPKKKEEILKKYL